MCTCYNGCVKIPASANWSSNCFNRYFHYRRRNECLMPVLLLDKRSLRISLDEHKQFHESVFDFFKGVQRSWDKRNLQLAAASRPSLFLSYLLFHCFEFIAVYERIFIHIKNMERAGEEQVGLQWNEGNPVFFTTLYRLRSAGTPPWNRRWQPSKCIRVETQVLLECGNLCFNEPLSWNTRLYT